MDKGKGKGRSNATLGDCASNFMAQWNASRSGDPSANTEFAHGATETRSKRDVEQTLHSWRRGGAEVKVTKGTSIGYEMRQKKQIASRQDKSSDLPAFVPELDPPSPSLVPQPVPTPVAKSLRERLLEASADVRSLRIAGAMSRSRGIEALPPVVEDKDGRLAILGLDFGTAFSKAVVRWSGRHHAVDWSEAVEGDDHYLLASVFSEAPDGLCVLGAHEAPGWTVLEGVKLQLLSSGESNLDDRMADAVIFIALAFRHVDRWMRKTSRDAADGIRWRLHVGLPTKSWNNDATTETFKIVAQAARFLACTPGAVTRDGAVNALRKTDQVDRPAVDVFPEFACQLYSYLLSPERGEDLHALVDIGAGTLDVAFFNVFMKDGEALLPIFASEVDRLGAHYLIAALSGVESGRRWADGESSLSDDEVGRKLDCPPCEVFNRRSLYLSSVADVFHQATCAARKMYPTSPAFQRFENVRLFLCGGGSRIRSLRKRFDRIAKEAASVLGIRFQVSELVRPRDLVGHLESGFDRLSVAYGLSQNAANIGHVMRSATLDPLLPRERVDAKHRDDDR